MYLFLPTNDYNFIMMFCSKIFLHLFNYVNEMITLKSYLESQGTLKLDEEIMMTTLRKILDYMIGMRYGPKLPKSQRLILYSEEYVQTLESHLAKVEEALAIQ